MLERPGQASENYCAAQFAGFPASYCVTHIPLLGDPQWGGRVITQSRKIKNNEKHKLGCKPPPKKRVNVSIKRHTRGQKFFAADKFCKDKFCVGKILVGFVEKVQKIWQEFLMTKVVHQNLSRANFFPPRCINHTNGQVLVPSTPCPRQRGEGKVISYSGEGTSH